MVFQVKLCKSGNQFDVDESETVLDAALRSGYVISYSCRSGSCGSCKARIVSGSVDYGDYSGNVLTESDHEQGFALLCQAHPLEDLVVDAREVTVAEGIEIKLLPCRVTRLQRLNHDVMGVSLKLPQNKQFNYLAGQYIDILLRDGRRRSFSIANTPRPDGDLQLHVRLVPGGFFTHQIFNTMKKRDLLRFEGPLGTFFLRQDSDRPVILMAGGTGFAPIKAIIEQAIERNIERPMHLFWGVRSEADLYMDDLARQWSDQHPHILYTPVLSEAGPEPVRVTQARNTGWVHDAVVERYPDLSRHEVYMSGPPPMIDAGYSAFEEKGLPGENLFFDSFEFAADVPRT
jgi:CDP-4-dehydro-6-deoxyglucose reductase